MLSLRTIGKICNRRFRKSVSLVCIVCFFIASLLSSSLVVAFAEHDHDYFTGCPRTQRSVCLCEGDSDQTQILAEIRLVTLTQDHDNATTSCLACVILFKIVDPMRQTGLAISCATLADLNCLALNASCSLPILSGFYTPVELKIKMSN